MRRTASTCQSLFLNKTAGRVSVPSVGCWGVYAGMGVTGSVYTKKADFCLGVIQRRCCSYSLERERRASLLCANLL